MARVEQQTIELIVSKNDIVEVIGSFLQLIRKGHNYTAVCPFHDDTNPSLSIDTRKQIFKCFVCNTGGNALRFVMLFNKWSLIKSLQYLADKAGISFDETQYNPSHNKEDNNLSEFDQKVYEILDRANSCFKSEIIKSTNTSLKSFISKRKLDYATCKKFDIGYDNPLTFEAIFKDDLEKQLNVLSEASLISMTSKENFFQNRVTFGIRDEKNRIVGFSARVLDNTKPKYINSSESKYFKKSSILYNFNNALESNSNELILAEGFFDVIALSKANFTNAVCLMGTAITKEHIAKLKKFKKIVIFLDGDEPGQFATYKTIVSLLKYWYSSAKKINVVKNTTGYDPDEILNNFGANKLTEMISNTIDYSEFSYDFLRSKHSILVKNYISITEAEWNKFSEDFYPIWKTFDSDVANVYLNKIKDLYNKDLNLTLNKNTFNNDKYTSDFNENSYIINHYDENYELVNFDDYTQQPYYTDTDVVDHYLMNNKAKLAQKNEQKNQQDWIEKVLLLVLYHPDLIKLFKRDMQQKPLSSIKLEEYTNDVKKTLYSCFIEELGNSNADLEMLRIKYKDYSSDFLKFNHFDSKTPQELENDYEAIINRARRFDRNYYNLFIQNQATKSQNPLIQKNAEKGIRLNKIANETSE
ncbi:DNA primase [Mycoplasmopsis felifaucium]|uniref:DNA primase n=1 Tax=Mycoplasmopsis felifaucium TaxID=35768 RepID=A0ABZ2RT99_9BACT|nr:DNA primase [Mycoplasmopsis felifaucium]